jgi:hypothetical protein
LVEVSGSNSLEILCSNELDATRYGAGSGGFAAPLAESLGLSVELVYEF